MKLKDVLYRIPYSGTFSEDAEVSGICYDSRRAAPGSVFIALRGYARDGHFFALNAYHNGCRIFALEREVALPPDAVQLLFRDTRAALSAISANFFSHPDRDIKVIGVTGTNGKTTITYMLQAAFEKAGIKAGVIGTNGACYDGNKFPTCNTTPESYEMQRFLRQMADCGCQYAFVEVSSLGVKQKRVEDVRFFTAVFSNFSPDHVGGNEHDSIEEYRACKQQIFSMCDHAVLNIDDAEYQNFFEASRCDVHSFGIYHEADYTADNVRPYLDHEKYGVAFTLLAHADILDVCVNLPGEYSVYNALAVFAVADLCGVPFDSVAEALQDVQVDGRTEHFLSPNGVDVFIDYAHNGSGVENLLKTLKAFPHRKIISVFGCVGGRAFLRRSGMGEASGQNSDLTVLTSDDPNDENPEGIMRDVAQYVEAVGGKYVMFTDRKQAIKYALSVAQAGDFVLLLGKGHEKFQKVGEKAVPFSDKAALQEIFCETGAIHQ